MQNTKTTEEAIMLPLYLHHCIFQRIVALLRCIDVLTEGHPLLYLLTHSLTYLFMFGAPLLSIFVVCTFMLLILLINIHVWMDGWTSKLSFCPTQTAHAQPVAL